MLDVFRRYVHGFVNSHDFATPLEIMGEHYTLHAGAATLVGRDVEYLPAVQRQMDQFPTLGYSIHELVTDGEKVAVRFSEHGRSARQPDREAAWIGVGIYRAEEGRLVECWVEQDHYGKRRQLATGISDPVQQVATDPWADHADASPDATTAAEPLVRAWLSSLTSWPPADAHLDPGQAHTEQPRIRVSEATLECLVAEGSKVGFNARITGEYEGGLPELMVVAGQTVETWVGAIGDIVDGAVRNLRGASNRIAVQRRLRNT